MSASEGQTTDLARGLRLIISGLATMVTVALALSLLVGGPLFAGIFGGLESGVAWLVLLAAVAYVGYYSDQLSFPFTLSFVAVLLLLTTVLPPWLTEPFAFITDSLIGEQLADIDPVRFAVLAGATIIMYWSVTTRLFGRGKKPSAVGGRVQSRTIELAREYAKLGRIAFVIMFSVVFIFAGQLGDVFGELFGLVSGAPVVSTYATTLFAGFGSFVADWPVIGGLSAEQFGLIAVALFIIGVSIKYTGVID